MLETVVRRCHHKPLRWGIQGDNEEATRIPQVIYPRLINEIFTALAPYHQNSGRETVDQFNEGMAPRFTGRNCEKYVVGFTTIRRRIVLDAMIYRRTKNM